MIHVFFQRGEMYFPQCDKCNLCKKQRECYQKQLEMGLEPIFPWKQCPSIWLTIEEGIR